MADFGDAVRAGIRAARDEYTERRERPLGESYAAADRPVICLHCGGQRFTSRSAMLNSRVLTLIDLDWLDRSATALICTKCTEIRFFAEAPVAVPDR